MFGHRLKLFLSKVAALFVRVRDIGKPSEHGSYARTSQFEVDVNASRLPKSARNSGQSKTLLEHDSAMIIRRAAHSGRRP
jgi:hypothetical protein